MSQESEIIEAFQLHGMKMTLGQMSDYPWFFEFRSRKVEINKADPKWSIRFVKKGERPSDNLYLLEPKPRPGELI